MAFGFFRICNAVVNLAVTLVLLLLSSFAAYALWDNTQVLAAASDVRADMIRLKPEAQTPGEPDNTAGFSELRQINPDVCGWITMDGTNIDFPILQGENNMRYISRDVYGNFSLAGSIFLDSRNDLAFGDPYSLLYGHHMADGNMFGDLKNYKEAAFFQENQTGQLILPGQSCRLEVLACMLVSASDQRIFDPEAAAADIPALLEFAGEHSLHIREELLQRLGKGTKILALSTCSSEYADARTILLTVMEPVQPGRLGGEMG